MLSASLYVFSMSLLIYSTRIRRITLEAFRGQEYNRNPGQVAQLVGTLAHTPKRLWVQVPVGVHSRYLSHIDLILMFSSFSPLLSPSEVNKHIPR